MSKLLALLALLLYFLPPAAHAQNSGCFSSGGALVSVGGFIVCISSGGGGGPPMPCPQSSGTLTLAAQVTRSSGGSPLNVWFDAQATTDSSLTGIQTPTQDVIYTWNFKDPWPSGTTAWLYGSNPNGNSRNNGTGIEQSHLYDMPDGTGDTTVNPTVTATNPVTGTSVSCTLAVTIQDASLTNGWPNAETTCISSSGTPVAGTGGCPAGAAVLNTGTLTAAIGGNLSNKRRLLKCGDNFTGGASISGVRWSVNQYGPTGGCNGVQTGLPTITGTMNVSMQCVGNAAILQTCDGRIANLIGNTGGSAMFLITSNYTFVPAQLTFFNFVSNATNTSYYEAECVQCAYIQLTTSHMGTQQGTYIHLAGNICENGQSNGTYNCGQTTPVFNPMGYMALQGGNFDGTGAPGGAGIETVRISGCQECVITNNRFANANTVGAVLKFHNNNTATTQNQYLGQPNQLDEISDNEFTGTSGGECVEMTPQNNQTDEHIQLLVFERNYVHACTGQVLVSVHNGSFRDNVFNGSNFAFGQRGSEFTPVADYPCSNGVGVCPGAPPMDSEFYNNTWYNGGSLLITSGSGNIAAGINSVAKNNLIYLSSAINNGGTGNTVSNNSPVTSANPGFTDPSGSFKFITDFVPTANATGGVTVPVLADAVGVKWPPTWSLGALHP